jgi:mRNA interferase RelE/StbE
MFEIRFSPSVVHLVEDADSPLRNRLERCFDQLRQNPRHHNNIKRLKGEFAGIYRFRIEDWRVLYRINEEARQIVIVDIGHRRDVYE